MWWQEDSREPRCGAEDSGERDKTPGMKASLSSFLTSDDNAVSRLRCSSSSPAWVATWLIHLIGILIV